MPRPADVNIEFGDTLRELREERGLSQESVALDSGLDRSYYGKIERGASSPTVRTVVRVAPALGVSPSELFERFQARTRRGGA